MWRKSMALAVGFLAVPAAAQAQDCVDEMALLRQQYHLSGEAAQAPPPGDERQSGSVGISPQELGRSGGVIQPPDTGLSGRVVRLPAGIDPQMSTPELQPRRQVPTGSGLDAAERAQMESLLAAARAAHERGDDNACLEAVGRARAIPAPG